jgi:hypothetical protein
MKIVFFSKMIWKKREVKRVALISYRPLITKVASYVKQWTKALAAKPKILPHSIFGHLSIMDRNSDRGFAWSIKITKKKRVMRLMASGVYIGT